MLRFWGGTEILCTGVEIIERITARQRFTFLVSGGVISDNSGAPVMNSPDLECDFSRDVNVKQMDFAVESHQHSCRRVHGIS